MSSKFIPDKIILGHNQFFGTDHMSSERGAERARYFSKIDNVIKIIRFAYDNGTTGLMLSTHENSKAIIKGLLQDKVLKENLNIYVLLPYMAKYVRMANERGMVNMVGEILGGASWSKKLGIMSKGGIGLLQKDIGVMLKSLIDIELIPFKPLKVRAVFLHNALSDMIAGFQMKNVAHLFIDYISEKHKIEPAFCTLNSPLLMNFLKKAQIKNPLLMAPFNKIGFQMNPSKEKCVEILNSIPSRTIAMSTLGAGYIKPDEAYQYLSTISEIKSTVVGASSKKHIIENNNLIKKYI